MRYDGAKNTCEIVTNANLNTRDLIAAQSASTQRIIDTITQDNIDRLRSDLQAAQLQISNQAQTAAIVSQVRPTAVPAYPSCSPYGGGCGVC